MSKRSVKRPAPKRSKFGEKLQAARRRGKDPDTGGLLTQERFAELLARVCDQSGYSHVDVSRWEKGLKGGKIIRHDARPLLLCIIQILYQCGGLQSLAEANDLLVAGEYRLLDGAEIERIAHAWLPDETGQESSAVTETTEQQLLYSTLSTDIFTPGIPRRETTAPFMVPQLPPQGIVGRDKTLGMIASYLQLQDEQALNVPPLALRGMGGIGKTTLSIAFGRLETIRRQFPDGILWVVLGPTPTVRLQMESWGRALGLDLQPERDEDACQIRLQEALYHRRALLIVDDIWEIGHGKYFMVAGPHCRTLLTTRELPVAHHLATRDRTLKVDVLDPEAALQLLIRLAPETGRNEAIAKQLCERLEYLPLALTLAGRMLANEAEIPTRMKRLTDELLERRESRLQLLQAEGRLGIETEEPVSLQAILGLSVDRLSELDKTRFAMAGLFGGDPLTWEIGLASHVWECAVEEAEDTIARLIQRGLVERKENGRYWMHALLADYAQELMHSMGL